MSGIKSIGAFIIHVCQDKLVSFLQSVNAALSGRPAFVLTPSAIYHHGNLHQLFSSCMDTNLLCSSAAVNLPKTSYTPQHSHTGRELNTPSCTHTPADDSGVCECERVCASCVEY